MIKKHLGFTLIELLVVIAILSLLTSIVLVSTKTATSKARDARRIEEITQIRTAVEMYYAKYSYYPQSDNSSGPWNWSMLLGILKTEGLISISPENKHRPNLLSEFFLSEAKAIGAWPCPPNLKPQDPLCGCKKPTDVFTNLSLIGPSYEYYMGSGQQSYKIRAKLENDNVILQSSLVGDFRGEDDNGCDSVSRYYCIGNTNAL